MKSKLTGKLAAVGILVFIFTLILFTQAQAEEISATVQAKEELNSSETESKVEEEKKTAAVAEDSKQDSKKDLSSESEQREQARRRLQRAENGFMINRSRDR